MVGLLHGRMPAAEKAAVMSLFDGGQMAVLVSTTVIEVGVDVPNASLMVIEHAERFGLSQLHQLRGRVGRGAVGERLRAAVYAAAVRHRARRGCKAMAETNDGFEIARRDLEIRGPGRIPRRAAVRCAAAALRRPERRLGAARAGARGRAAPARHAIRKRPRRTSTAGSAAGRSCLQA